MRRHPFIVISNMPTVAANDPLDEPPLAESWGNLVDHIRIAAVRVREDEARIQQREDLLRTLAIRTRDEMQCASERAERAEAHAREIEVQAKLDIAAWQTRTFAAEEKVRELEGWLAEVSETFRVEFGLFA